MSSRVLDHVSRFRQVSFWKREAGGQLFARVDADQWIIEEATGPRGSDLRSRFSFRPDRLAEQREIEDRFEKGLHFVGDWHTHPEAHPKPSYADHQGMNDMVRASRHELSGFLMMIVGTAPGAAGIWLSLHFTSGSWVRVEAGNLIKHP